MDKKHFLAAVGAALFLAVAIVTAGSQAANTPLYTVRMEQESSKMHFLPTEVNEFVYNAESGYNLYYNVSGYCSGEYLNATGDPCVITIGATCDSTCPPTCGYTCGCTCGFTCDTCVMTCGYTCNPSCDAITCDSCSDTCITCSSCSITCSTC